MTDEGFEQQASGDTENVHQQDTPPFPISGVVPGAGIPLPPVTPPTQEPAVYRDDRFAPGTPPPPVDPPVIPVGGVPYGSYALGALAGNPQLGTPVDSGHNGPPTVPGSAGWAPPPPPNPPQTGGHRRRVGALIGGAAVVALAAGVGIGHVAWSSNAPSVSAAPATNSGTGSGGSGSSGPFGSGGSNSGGSNSGGSNSSGGSGPNDVSSIAQKVDPGLVDIDTTLGFQQEEAAGTGIVLTSSGEILTNNHVIDGATTISVTDIGNGKTYSASVVGYNRTKDIAVLQLHGASGLQTATIGDSSDVSVGENVVGIGNAGGTGGTPSAAGGTVTALNQSITASDEGDGTSEQLTGLIETNADIQAGDSGGSLVNSSGEVVGIDTAASAGFSFHSSSGQSSGNQGYAIPINAAISIAKAIEAGTASSTTHIGSTAFLGVEVAQGSCSSGVGSGNSGFGSGGFGSGSGSGFGSGTSGSASSGALICTVVTSSPAQEGGLAQGDTITSVDSHTVASPSGLTNLLEPFHPGDKVTIGWSDASGQSHTGSVQLSSGPPQ
jgi:S1-C subfamily serine protease